MEEIDTTDRALGRVEGKLDLVLLHLTHDAKKRDEAHADHERRIVSVERKVWWGAGVAAALTTFIAGKFTLPFLPH